MAQRPESYVLRTTTPQVDPSDHFSRTVARSFAADLDSMFGLSPNVDGLSQTVEEKYDTTTVSP